VAEGMDRGPGQPNGSIWTQFKLRWDAELNAIATMSIVKGKQEVFRMLNWSVMWLVGRILRLG